MCCSSRTDDCCLYVDMPMKRKWTERKIWFILLICSLFYTFASVRVTWTSKVEQTAAIRTVAKSLPNKEVIFLIFFIIRGYKSYTDLRKYSLSWMDFLYYSMINRQHYFLNTKLSFHYIPIHWHNTLSLIILHLKKEKY